MPEQIAIRTKRHAIHGLDAEATPLIGIGLGLTGLALGLRPRLAPIPLALTALAALLYRDPDRTTPHHPGMLFAVADGIILSIDEVYEHRFLHTDAIRIATLVSPLNVPVNRSPTAGVVRYLEQQEGETFSVQNSESVERNTRTYIGIETIWGPIMIVQIAGPFSRRVTSYVQEGDILEPGERVGTVRFGSRADIIVQRDSINVLVGSGQKLLAGQTPIAQVVPLS